jgi:hypothetical protein
VLAFNKPPALLRHHGVELPVHTTESVAWHKYDISRAASSTEETFIRVIRISPEAPFDGLHDLLRYARRSFTRITKETDTKSTLKQFGFAPLPVDLSHAEMFHTASRLLPSSYGLVAEVEAVKNPIPILPTEIECIYSGIQRYIRDARSHDEPHLEDFTRIDSPSEDEALIHEQFVKGTASKGTGIYLTDVDLYIR